MSPQGPRRVAVVSDTTAYLPAELAEENGIALVSSSFQGALIANKDVIANTTSRHQGSMVSVYNGVVSGQTGTLTFPSPNFAPAGTGGVTQELPAGKLLPPLDFGG